MRIIIFAAILIGSINLTGCAFGTRQTELSYPPSANNGGLIASAEASEANLLTSRNIILKVTDDRSEKSRIGNVRNGFGMDTADVVTQSNIEKWVEDALTLELNNAGYRVLKTSEAGEDSINLNAEVRDVYCDVYFTYDADVNLMVDISSPGKQSSRKAYNGEGSVGLNWAATAASYAESLSLALQNAISLIISDLQKMEE